MGNPFHLTDEVCRRLKDCGCVRYQMSIDGLEETHDWFRKPDSYKTTLDKVAMLNGAGIRSIIMTTVSDKNIDEVPQIIDAVVVAGAKVYAFARYCPTSEEKNTNITPQRYRELLAECDRKFRAMRKPDARPISIAKTTSGRSMIMKKDDSLYQEGAEPDLIYGGCNCGQRI